MPIETFNGKKILIETIKKRDLKKIKEFQVFINSLVEEEAKILMNKKATIKDEKQFIDKALQSIKNKNKVFLIARDGNKIVGNTSIERERWRKNHIGRFGIAIAQGYRGIGLGKYLMSKIIELAKKEFGQDFKIIQLEVYVNNKPAINLYKKMGFKIVAKIPKQIQYKGKLISEFVMSKQV